MERLSAFVSETVNTRVAQPRAESIKPNRRKRTSQPPMFANLVPDNGKTSPPKRKKLSPENERPATRNRGVQSKHFNYQARGLHLKWEKFSLSTDGTLVDGLKNPVGEKILVTTTTTPERPPPAGEKLSPLAELAVEVESMKGVLRGFGRSLDESVTIMREMRESLGN
jgi:hypothetical protein